MNIKTAFSLGCSVAGCFVLGFGIGFVIPTNDALGWIGFTVGLALLGVGLLLGAITVGKEGE